MPHPTGPSTPAATFTAVDEKLDSTSQEDAQLVFNNDITSDHLPYWLVNVPRSQWPSECPGFLRDLSPKNIRILSMPDEAYQRTSWEVVKDYVLSNRIDRFQRLPSDLRKYLEYTSHIKAQYGSVMRFVVKERLHWGDGDMEDLKPKGRPFELDEDIKILYNDWPYGIDKGVIHLVVWVKFVLEEEPGTDALKPQTRKDIEDYVQKTFCSRVPSDQVIWFKNWKSLKSVHAVEHFHVMLHRPDPEFVKEITGGDVPLIDRIGLDSGRALN